MSRVYLTSIGTPNERTRKQYATSAGAKQWCRAKLSDHKDWCDAYNVELGVKVAEISKEIDEMNITAMPPNVKHHWTMTDDQTNVTFVVELWVEER